MRQILRLGLVPTFCKCPDKTQCKFQSRTFLRFREYFRNSSRIIILARPRNVCLKAWAFSFSYFFRSDMWNLPSTFSVLAVSVGRPKHLILKIDLRARFDCNKMILWRIWILNRNQSLARLQSVNSYLDFRYALVEGTYIFDFRFRIKLLLSDNPKLKIMILNSSK